MVNTNKLKGKIVEAGYTLKEFADAMEMSPPTFSGKLHGSSFFNTQQIGRITDLLGIPKREIPDYFFENEEGKMPTMVNRYAE